MIDTLELNWKVSLGLMLLTMIIIIYFATKNSTKSYKEEQVVNLNKRE